MLVTSIHELPGSKGTKQRRKRYNSPWKHDCQNDVSQKFKLRRDGNDCFLRINKMDLHVPPNGGFTVLLEVDFSIPFHLEEPNTFFLNQRMLSFLKSLSIYPPKKNKFWGQVGVNYFEASGIPSLDLTVDEKLVSEWVLPWKKWSLQSWTWS